MKGLKLSKTVSWQEKTKLESRTLARTGKNKVRKGIIDRDTKAKGRKAKTVASEEKTRSQTRDSCLKKTGN
jgi:hypothetical protein